MEDIKHPLEEITRLLKIISSVMPPIDGKVSLISEDVTADALWFAAVDKDTAEPYIDIVIDNKYIRINIEELHKMVRVMEVINSIEEDKRADVVDLVFNAI
jgi:hypothetical protein